MYAHFPGGLFLLLSLYRLFRQGILPHVKVFERRIKGFAVYAIAGPFSYGHGAAVGRIHHNLPKLPFSEGGLGETALWAPKRGSPQISSTKKEEMA